MARTSTELLLTRADRDSSEAGKTSSDLLPPIVVDQALRRLQGLCAVFAAATPFAWLLPHLLAGTLIGELSRPWDSIPLLVAILFSALLFFLIRGTHLPKSTLVGLGLVYQVVVSYALAFAQGWGTFTGVPPHELNFDRVGISLVGVWMITGAVLVPHRPNRVFISLCLSALAPGIVLLLSSNAHGGPTLAWSEFGYVFVFPYLLCAVAAYLASQTLYRLGRDLHRATEMGAYRLVSMIGRGGMGEVWKAQHQMLARPAAVKLIRPEAVAVGNSERASSILDRFEREAQATAALTSHHTIELYDFGVSEAGSFYYVMELLDGVDLETLVLRHGPVAPERATFLLLQACHSLADAHHRKLIHRDIKPANIFVCHRGLEYDFVKVLDFGLVTRLNDEPDDVRLTAEGRVIATPAYLPPEMASGAPADPRSDIYALGCVAYWLVTGSLVFEAETTIEMILAHANKTPVAPSTLCEQEVSPVFDELVLQCLEKSPDDRPQSVAALVERLRDSQTSAEWTNADAAEWWANRESPTSRN